jgi:hypothetical protein
MRPLAFAFALAATAAGLGYWLGDSYTARLSNHAGYHLVAVPDSIAAAPRSRPRRVVFVVVDGLRGDAAAQTDSMTRLRREGVCATTYMGPLTVSRPNYAVLSTGLEADRTGARHNVDTSPLAAEPLWQVAREAGLRVTLASHLDWWGELFPGAFDRHVVLPLDRDLLGDMSLSDVTVLHPLYVDEAGHDHGARSVEYAAAVARFDRELERLIDRLDLDRDLVVVTADHGHVGRGGHGGDQPEIARVLTCLAGAGVRRDSGVDWLEATSVAPAVAVLAGLRLPRHMRAGDVEPDPLEPALRLADPTVLGEDYLADRARAIARFHAINRDELDGGPRALAGRENFKRRIFGGIAALVIGALLLGSLRRRRRSLPGAAASLVWIGATLGAALLVYAAIRGSLDLTSVNTRSGFVRTSLAVAFATGAIAAIVHLAIARDLSLLIGDQLTVVGLLLAGHLAHRWVYGAPLGYPLPGSFAIFAPLLGAALLIAHAVIAAGLIAAAVALAWRRASDQIDQPAEQAAGDQRAEHDRGRGDRRTAVSAAALEDPGQADLARSDPGD